jgi:serine/threonine-protein kinase
VQVTDVTGKPAAAATAALRRQGLRASVTQAYSDTVGKGLVVATDPAAGTTVRAGRTVAVTVSRGPRLYPVPDVTKDGVRAAIATVKRDGFTPKPVEIFPGGPGDVIRESPGPGTPEPHGTTVEIDYF